MKKNTKYIIYSSAFDENSGGVIALHLLCHSLNVLGQDAYIWPMGREVARFFSLKANLLNIFSLGSEQKFLTNSRLNTPVAKCSDLRNSIVVYPEIISGNPLNSSKVVRWFLNKPGFFTGEVNYGSNELYFYYSPQFNNNDINVNNDGLLKTVLVMDDIYKQVNFGVREGSCYILRKGKDRKTVHDLTNSILIDGLTHDEIANIFNKTKYCFSYDPYTMLSKYAAMCGCISVVIPLEGVTKDVWRPNLEDRYGIAYGVDDINWAVSTQNMVAKTFKTQLDMVNYQVREFVKKTTEFFNG